MVQHTADESSHAIPRVIHSCDTSRLWYKSDAKFLLPKAVLKIELRSPLAYLDPRHVNMSHMYVELLKDSLTEYAYAAELAGLKYAVSAHSYGITLSLSGFSHKMPLLLATLAERMATLRVCPRRFAVLKESYARALANFDAEQPYKHAVYYVGAMISEKWWSKQQLLDSMEAFTLDDVQTFVSRLLSGVFVEALAFGNVTPQQSIDMVRTVQDKIR